MQPKEQLTQIINTSNLTAEDKELWQQAIENLEEDDLQAILDILNEDPSQLSFLTGNLRTKVNALKSDDQNAWDLAVSEEEQYSEKF